MDKLEREGIVGVGALGTTIMIMYKRGGELQRLRKNLLKRIHLHVRLKKT